MSSRPVLFVFSLRFESFEAPMGLAAIYCHPLEFFLSDLMPLGAGLVAVRTNGFAGAVWMAFAVMATQTHHCGIRWPWIDFFSFEAHLRSFKSLRHLAGRGAAEFP